MGKFSINSGQLRCKRYGSQCDTRYPNLHPFNVGAGLPRQSELRGRHLPQELCVAMDTGGINPPLRGSVLPKLIEKLQSFQIMM